MFDFGSTGDGGGTQQQANEVTFTFNSMEDEDDESKASSSTFMGASFAEAGKNQVVHAEFSRQIAKSPVVPIPKVQSHGTKQHDLRAQQHSKPATQPSSRLTMSPGSFKPVQKPFVPKELVASQLAKTPITTKKIAPPTTSSGKSSEPPGRPRDSAQGKGSDAGKASKISDRPAKGSSSHASSSSGRPHREVKHVAQTTRHIPPAHSHGRGAADNARASPQHEMRVEVESGLNVADDDEPIKKKHLWGDEVSTMIRITDKNIKQWGELITLQEETVEDMIFFETTVAINSAEVCYASPVEQDELARIDILLEQRFEPTFLHAIATPAAFSLIRMPFEGSRTSRPCPASMQWALRPGNRTRSCRASSCFP